MPLTRRNFLIRGSLSLAAGALSPVLVEAKTRENAPADFKDWESVRRQFELAPDYIHLALFFLASHPRPVRQAIEQYRAKIDANPLLTVENAIFVQTNENIPLQVCRAIANYIGGDGQDIALHDKRWRAKVDTTSGSDAHRVDVRAARSMRQGHQESTGRRARR